MKKPYGKIFSVASIVVGLCASGAAFGDTVGVTKKGTGTKSTVNLQPDYNEDNGRYINSPNNPAMHPDFNLVSEVNKVDIDFMTTIVARYSLYDQTRKQNFDFLNQNALFGVHMFKSGWSADLLVRFSGRTDQKLRNSNFVIDQGTGEIVNIASDSVGYVGIRKADIGFRFYKDQNNLLKVRLGRFAPFGATAYDDDNVVRAWGTDATVNLWGPSGSGDLHGIYVDGAALFYQAKWGGHSRLNVEAGVASDLPVFLYLVDATGHFNIHDNPYQAFGNDTSFGFLSTNTSRAWLADIAYQYDARWGKIQMAIDGGGKTRAEQNYTTPFYGGTALANNMYYLATSIGYSMDDKLQVGLWYNMTHVGDAMTGTITAPDHAVDGYTKTGLQNAGNYMTFGAGINGTSKLWGMNHVGGKDGVMTWGLGYERFAMRNGFTSAYTAGVSTAKQDVNLYSAAIGYARGPATVELDWAVFGAGDRMFYRQNNREANWANVLYLVGTFDI